MQFLAFPQRLVGLFHLRAVLHDLDETTGLPVRERQQHSRRPETSAVLVEKPAGVVGASLIDRPSHFGHRNSSLAVARDEDRVDGVADDFRVEPAEQSRGGRVPRPDQAVPADDDDRMSCGLAKTLGVECENVRPFGLRIDGGLHSGHAMSPLVAMNLWQLPIGIVRSCNQA